MTRGIIEGTQFGTPNANVFSLLATAESESALRLQRYRRFWRFYKGKHWDWTRDVSEPFVTINYARKFVDVMVNFLMKGGFKITIPDDPATPEKEDDDREFVRLMLEQTWEWNSKELTGLEMAQMGGITGDCFVRVSWDDNPLFERPHSRVDILPSQFVFPEFGGPIGVDRKKVNSVLVLFPRFEEAEFVQRRRYGQVDKKLQLFGERWYPDRVEYYDTMENGSGEPTAVEDNPLGEIPIVHIPNYPLASEFYGMSDLLGIVDLQRELNEKATDLSDVVSYHGSPVTIIKGASLANLERGANRMWGIPPEATVENLELKGDMKVSMEYLKMIKKAMHEIGSIPEGVLGSFQSTEAMSAAAIALRYLPLIENRNVKEQTYGMGIRKINRLIMKITDLMDNDFHKEFKKLNPENRFRNDVVFADPLPRDEMIELNKAEKRLDLNLSSRRREMEKSGLSQAEIRKVKEDIKADRQEQADMEFNIGQQFVPETEEQDPDNRSGNPNPRRPDPDSQGESRSQAAVDSALESTGAGG